MPENPIDESRRWLAQARSDFAESKLRAAREAVSRVLDRTPDHAEALQLLGEIIARDRGIPSGVTTFFNISSEELRRKLTEALDVLHAAYDGIQHDIDAVRNQPAPAYQIDDKIRIADIAAIKECLSKRA